MGVRSNAGIQYRRTLEFRDLSPRPIFYADPPNRSEVSKFKVKLSDSAIAVFRNFNTISFLLLIITKKSRVPVNFKGHKWFL